MRLSGTADGTAPMGKSHAGILKCVTKLCFVIKPVTYRGVDKTHCNTTVSTVW